jgi:hypothetical protein
MMILSSTILTTSQFAYSFLNFPLVSGFPAAIDVDDASAK